MTDFKLSTLNFQLSTLCNASPITHHGSHITILLSIITVTYNSKDVITECLSSLEAKLENISSEIIVIDNHSTDNTVGIIKEQFPSVHVIENIKNEGFAAACNQGIKNSSGDFLLFLNPDIIAGEKFSFPPLFQYMNEHKNTGLLGCKLINRDGTIQTSCRKFPDIITVMFKRISFFQIFPYAKKRVEEYIKPLSNYEEITSVDWLLGAFLFIRREIIDKIGHFDERFYIYFEDVDFCRRVHYGGYNVCYYPLMEVIHHHKRESAKGFNLLLLVHIWSGIKYFWKWTFFRNA